MFNLKHILTFTEDIALKKKKILVPSRLSLLMWHMDVDQFYDQLTSLVFFSCGFQLIVVEISHVRRLLVTCQTVLTTSLWDDLPQRKTDARQLLKRHVHCYLAV